MNFLIIRLTKLLVNSTKPSWTQEFEDIFTTSLYFVDKFYCR